MIVFFRDADAVLACSEERERVMWKWQWHFSQVC